MRQLLGVIATLVALWQVCVNAQGQNPTIPPSITFKPDYELFFASDHDSQKYTCKAEGTKPITYTWRKKTTMNSPFKPILGVMDGVLSIAKPTYLDEGYYQCFAENNRGKAMSRVFKLTKGVLGAFTFIEDESKTSYIGEHMVFKCNNQPRSAPPLSVDYTWVEQEKTDPNLVTDQNGDFHILVNSALYAVPDSGAKEKKYRCGMYNRITRTKAYGQRFSLQVIDNGKPRLRQPAIYFYTIKPESREAMMGNNNSFALQCIPSGNPLPSIEWLRDGQVISSLPQYKDRLEYKYNIKYTMIVSHIREKDEGNYRCQIKNQPDIYKNIFVSVRSKPLPIAGGMFIPENTVLLAGTSKTFQCDGRSANSHSVVRTTWYRNSVQLLSGMTNNLNVDGKRLTINKASKMHDIMSMACVLTNNFGQVLYGFSVNVIDATEITENRVEITKKGDKEFMRLSTAPDNDRFITGPIQIRMTVEARADKLVQDDMYMVWKRNGVLIGNKNTKRPVYIDAQTEDLILQTNSSTDDKKHSIIDLVRGNYTCHVRVAGVRYSEIVLMINLIAPLATEGPLVKVAGFPYWIIGLIIGMIIFIILIILIVFLMYRNRGGIWKVDEKERAAGNNIDKELADSGFHDLGRADGPDEKKKQQGDQRSLSDDDQPPGEDTASLDEYGEPDMSKFNEEGSFIDMYGKPTRRSQARTDSGDYQPDGQLLYNNVTPPPGYSQFPDQHQQQQQQHSNDTMV